jgi:FkbM family methyltransferase
MCRYFASRAAHACGLCRAADQEMTLELGPLRVRLRPSQGELYLYKEVCCDRVYERHPDFLPRPGWTVVDLGANIGLYSLRVALGCPATRVLALEPNPDPFGRLRQNLIANGLTGRVRALRLAAGLHSGAAVFDPGPSSTLGHLVGPPAAWPEDRNLLRVQQVTLAELVTRERLERIHLLKLDVEGAEADVLAGAAPVLDRIERIVLEVHGPAAGRAVDRQLCTAGFRQVRWHQPAYVYYLREQACR